MKPGQSSIARVLIPVLLVLFGLFSMAPVTLAEGPVRFYYFYDPTCHVCHDTHEQVIEPLLTEYGPQVEITELSIAETANMELLLGFEAQHQVPSGDIPEVVIGDHILVGAFEIEDYLRLRIDEHLDQGGIELPFPMLADSTATSPVSVACDECGDTHAANRTAVAAIRSTAEASEPAAEISAVYFYQPGCDECERSEHDLRYVLEKYPQLVIERYNVKEDVTFNQYMCQETGVPEDRHLTAPALFVGANYLLGADVRAANIEAMIAPHLSGGSSPWWVGWDAQETQAQEAIVDRFRSFGVITVMGAGLLDGVNPCAFATMIFLISYLSLNKRKGKQLLATGAAFTLGVFLTYLGVGFGFLKALAALPFLNVIGKWVYGFTAALCLVLAWGSVADYRKARQGRLHDMGLTLPDSLRELSKKLIRQGTSAKRFVLSAFLLGIGVSFVELACTGQVYLPTIVYVLGIPALKTRATLMLLLYNAMFIAPLIGVFMMVYYGTTSQQLIDWLNRHAASVKLGMAALFVCLSGWLIFSIIAL